MRIMTLAEYADARGVSRPRISALKAAGRLVLTPDGKVDVDASDRLIVETGRGTPPPPDQGEAAAAGDRAEFWRHKTDRERTEAALADLRLRRQAGELVERAAVEAGAAEAGALLRSALEQLPGKIGAQLAAESDPARCRALLAREIDQALEDAADSLERLADAS